MDIRVSGVGWRVGCEPPPPPAYPSRDLGGLGIGAQGLEFGCQGFGCRVWSLGFGDPPPRLNHPPLEGPEMVGVEGLGLKIWGLGFGTLGLGFEV